MCFVNEPAVTGYQMSASRDAGAASSARESSRRTDSISIAPQGRTSRRHRLRICVADDSAVVRTAVADVVSCRTPHQIVAEACDGIEALKCVRQHQPDVLILDLRMPRADGLHVLCELSKAEYRPTVVVFTSDPSPMVRAKCLSAGANFCVEKNGRVTDLLKVLQKIAARKTRSDGATAGGSRHLANKGSGVDHGTN